MLFLIIRSCTVTLDTLIPEFAAVESLKPVSYDTRIHRTLVWYGNAQ